MGRTLAVVAAGGALGALARWAIGLAFPQAAEVATLAINVLGCLLIGVLVVEVSERRVAPPLVRPFLGTGVLGGFTTFSTASVDADQLLAAGRGLLAVGYAAGTLVACVAATAAGLAVARRAHR